MGIRVVRVKGDLYGIQSSYWSPAVNKACRATAGLKEERRIRTWIGYADAVWEAVQNLRKMNIIVDDRELPKPYIDDPTSPLIPVAYKGLRDYQKLGVDFLVTCSPSGALLADDMRLGKSLQALRAARAYGQKTLIVCPSYVRGVWGRDAKLTDGGGEIYKWWPEAFKKGIISLEGVEHAKKHESYYKLIELRDDPNAEPLEKDQRQELEYLDDYFDKVTRELFPDDALIAVAHYDIVHAWTEPLIRWGFKTFIPDEIHACQSETSRRTIACRRLARASARRMALSGTPMTNRPRDLWSVCDIISPGRFGDNFFTYAREFCDAHKETIEIKGPEKEKTVWNFDGTSNLETLKQRMRFFTLRRLREEVEKELPKVTRQMIDIDVPLTRRMGLSFDVTKNDRAMRAALDVAADAKLKPVISLLKDHIDQGKKVVCFTWRRLFAEEVVAALRKAHYDADFIHGGVTSLRKRQEKIQHCFDATKGCVLVCGIDACSTGIDLSFGDVTTFAEFTWEPWELKQAEARTYQYGKGVPIYIEYVIARGTVDELIIHGVVNKMEVEDKVFGARKDRLKEDLDATAKGDAALKRLEATLEKMITMPADKPAKKRKSA